MSAGSHMDLWDEIEDEKNENKEYLYEKSNCEFSI